MNYPYANEVLDTILAYFVNNNDVPRENMDEDKWDKVLQEQFNKYEEHYDSGYGIYYCDLLEIIHRNAEDLGIEPEYWKFNKMINLYMYIVAKKIIDEHKDKIIERWLDEIESENESESESESESEEITQ